jgi:hypothetical protein
MAGCSLTGSGFVPTDFLIAGFLLVRVTVVVLRGFEVLLVADDEPADLAVRVFPDTVFLPAAVPVLLLAEEVRDGEDFLLVVLLVFGDTDEAVDLLFVGDFFTAVFLVVLRVRVFFAGEPTEVVLVASFSDFSEDLLCNESAIFLSIIESFLKLVLNILPARIIGLKNYYDNTCKT